MRLRAIPEATILLLLYCNICPIIKQYKYYWNKKYVFLYTNKRKNTSFVAVEPNFGYKNLFSIIWCSFFYFIFVYKKTHFLFQYMNLLYSNCVPNLTYNCEVKDVSSFSSRELQDLNTALNNAVRRIFSYNKWESTRHLRQHLNFPNVIEIFRNRRMKFLTKCAELDNEVVRFVMTNFDIIFQCFSSL